MQDALDELAAALTAREAQLVSAQHSLDQAQQLSEGQAATLKLQTTELDLQAVKIEAQAVELAAQIAAVAAAQEEKTKLAADLEVATKHAFALNARLVDVQKTAGATPSILQPLTSLLVVDCSSTVHMRLHGLAAGAILSVRSFWLSHVHTSFAACGCHVSMCVGMPPGLQLSPLQLCQHASCLIPLLLVQSCFF